MVYSKPCALTEAFAACRASGGAGVVRRGRRLVARAFGLSHSARSATHKEAPPLDTADAAAAHRGAGTPSHAGRSRASNILQVAKQSGIHALSHVHPVPPTRFAGVHISAHVWGLEVPSYNLEL